LAAFLEFAFFGGCSAVFFRFALFDQAFEFFRDLQAFGHDGGLRV
jgi:hypothetical protein